jgi:CRP-like cAMP-binding protein
MINRSPFKTPTKMDLSERVRTLGLLYSFSHLTDVELKEIADLTKINTFNKGELIFQEADPADSFYVVHDGRVKLFKESHSGKDFIINFANRGYPLNMVALFEDQGFFFSAQALDETTLLRTSREEFVNFVTRVPSVATKLISILSRSLNSAYSRISDLVAETVEQRVYNLLLTLSSKFGTTVFIKREELADMVGTTPETAIRILGKLRDTGIIRSSRGQIIILDSDKLQRLSHRPSLIYL